ncbi:Alkaline phosphatase, tissue-nonspecific isozyme [Trichoplax sp. H2]|uniref:Alkaline phosphatase n=1 Tax=Trichoplax adhaerens TaxID=10228 RepID=B3RR74_TRIAD|nr:hypothetical protein TRIADDRAFT_54134 [Trichoplax adhaerens]EDV26294.1 hypothetical protein TRIADDRAFT_54134 [Trichoplax adhaerens]RDD45197.1 Alkaline phosphatase, tissue-nonspecific isozyme [Trichoplax sp. H2]|eukprot:XP_002110290.1 hypothetical protein TRIADDRAFT_54134 [Trichoplax adhaerens]
MKSLIGVAILFMLLAIANAQDTKTQVNNPWFTEGIKMLEEKLNYKPIKKAGNSVILFIGDGMSLTTVTAARIYQGQRDGKSGEEGQLSWEHYPHTGLAKTYNIDYQVPDSAGTATAYLCGVKTNKGLVGVTEKAKRGNCPSAKGTDVYSILTLAQKAGLSVGVVSTARITHATPAVTYAHTPEREWEGSVPAEVASEGCIDVAQQYINYQREHGGVNVMLGGGRRYFMSESQSDVEYSDLKGRRKDGKNLLDEWKKLNLPNSHYIWNTSAFNAVDPMKTDYLFGLFEYGHMQYEVNRNKGPGGEPSIAEMTRKAIQILRRNPKGYFLMVEAGRIDHGHHEGSAYRALVETVAMADAVDVANKMTNPNETLVVVTADHGHTMSMGGYQKRGNPIFGLTDDLDIYGNKYLTLNYANGPGGWDERKPRPRLTNEMTKDPHFLQQAVAKLVKETHDGTDVAVYAKGPFAHLYAGVWEQSFVVQPMMKALCLDASKPGQQHCKNSAGGIAPAAMLTLVMALFVTFFQNF